MRLPSRNAVAGILIGAGLAAAGYGLFAHLHPKPTAPAAAGDKLTYVAPPPEPRQARLYMVVERIDPASGAATVAMRFDSNGSPVNAVQANIDYDQKQLTAVDLDSSGSSLPIEAQAIAGNGRIRVARASMSPITGDSLIGRVAIKAASGAPDGTVKLSFSKGSAVVHATANNDIIKSQSGASLTLIGGTISAADPMAAPAITAPTGSQEGVDAAVLEKHVITDGKGSVTISWRTARASTGAVQYGPNNRYDQMLPANESSTGHSLRLTDLQSGKRYYYRIKVIEPSKQAAFSFGSTFVAP